MRIILGLIALSGACGGSSTVPDLAVAPSFCDDAAPALAPSFDNVSRLFTTYCVSCHAGTDVDLTRDKILSTLVGRAVPSYEGTDERCGGILVVPGDAGVSFLAQKVQSPTPCAGAQMPRAEFGSAPLPACATRLVVDWINAGAKGP